MRAEEKAEEVAPPRDIAVELPQADAQASTEATGCGARLVASVLKKQLLPLPSRGRKRSRSAQGTLRPPLLLWMPLPLMPPLPLRANSSLQTSLNAVCIV